VQPYCIQACDAAVSAVNGSILGLEADLLDSGMEIQIGIEGKLGMYMFCVAVVLSLLLGVFMELLEERHFPIVPAECETDDNTPRFLISFKDRKQLAKYSLSLGLVLATTALTCLAVVVPLFDRIVTGAMIQGVWDLVHIGFDDTYTNWQVGTAICEAGGVGPAFHAVCYFLFVLIGPLARVFSQLALFVVPMSLRRQRALFAWSRHASVFYALEVMLVAVPLMVITFGPISESVINVSSVPFCVPFDQKYDNPLCFYLAVTFDYGYYVMIAAVVMYCISSFDGSPVHKWMHSRLFPDAENAAAPNFPPGNNWFCVLRNRRRSEEFSESSDQNH